MRRTIHLGMMFLLASCGSPTSDTYHLEGNAQGTTFSIKYHGDSAEDLSSEFAQVLVDMDASLSLWKEDSFLSEINRMEGTKIGVPRTDRYFIPVLLLSKEIHEESNGYFDPSLYPLIKAWGFGARIEADEVPNVDSLKQVCGFSLYDGYIANVGPERLFIKTEGRQFDFNGIAQGYTVDALAQVLMKTGIEDFMIELGGEVLTSGAKKDGTPWKIAIDKPVSGPREIQTTIELTNKALATSGSYRKFYEKNGKKYSHTIDPYSGYPVDHQMLSVTVVMDDCGSADAYATAFMGMGLDKMKDYVSRRPSKFEVYAIYEENGRLQVWSTDLFQAD